MYQIQILKSGQNRVWPDIRRRIRPEPDSVIALNVDDVHDIA